MASFKELKSAIESVADDDFDLDVYLNNIKTYIKYVYNRTNKATTLDDILLNTIINDHSDEFEISKRIKQLQMKVGDIWQEVIGTFSEFKTLHTGHKTGLDIISHKRKVIIELKNRYNTDNASARKANYDKLSKYKLKHPDFRCIYGIINENSKNGKHFIINHNNIDIEYYSGNKFLKFIFGKHKKKIIEEVQNYISLLFIL